MYEAVLQIVWPVTGGYGLWSWT